MEQFLNEEFGAVKSKNSSAEALARWRKLCFFVKNRKRRFRNTANLPKRAEAKEMLRKNKVAKESADVVILDDNSATIVNVPRWGNSVYVNIQKFVQFQLTFNVVALVLNFVSACITGTAPLTAVQLLWVNLLMDTLGALALATEPPNDKLMKRLPVGRTQSFISNSMWRNIIGQSVYQLIVLAVLEMEGIRLLQLHVSNEKSILNTLIFITFVFCQRTRPPQLRNFRQAYAFSVLLLLFIPNVFASTTDINTIGMAERVHPVGNLQPNCKFIARQRLCLHFQCDECHQWRQRFVCCRY